MQFAPSNGTQSRLQSRALPRRAAFALAACLALVTGGALVGAIGTLALSPTKEEEPADKKPKTGGKAAELYARGKALCDQKKYPEALKVFQDAIKLEPADADVLNMLAFSQRKNGMLLDARENYRKALAIRPEFPEAREYLGENYIQLAKEQLDILRSYGAKGQNEAKDLAEAFKAAAAEVEKK